MTVTDEMRIRGRNKRRGNRMRKRRRREGIGGRRKGQRGEKRKDIKKRNKR